MRRFSSCRWHVAGVLVLLSAIFSLMLVTGCSENPLSSKIDDQNQQRLVWLNTTLGSGGPQLSTPLDSCLVVADTTLFCWVGNKGAVLDLADGSGKIQFQIPPNALYVYTPITIHVTKYVAPFGPFWLLDCGPNGTVFAKSLQVRLVNLDKQSFSVLFYYNEQARRWEVDQIDPTGNEDLDINHFSKYGIS